jgi:hypothetical protein
MGKWAAWLLDHALPANCLGQKHHNKGLNSSSCGAISILQQKSRSSEGVQGSISLPTPSRSQWDPRTTLQLQPTPELPLISFLGCLGTLGEVPRCFSAGASLAGKTEGQDSRTHGRVESAMTSSIC